MSATADPGCVLEHGPLRLKNCRHGPMLYLITDTYVGRSLHHYGEWAEREIRLLQQLVQAGQTVLDAGANIGCHTVPLAQAVGPQGRLLAFEPQPKLFQLLNANAALNHLQNASLHPEGLGAAACRMQLPRINYDQPANFGGVSLAAEADAANRSTRVLAMDELNLRELHLLKIDVEGMELEVLEGAERTIRRCRPAIYVENDRPERSKALIERLSESDYNLYWHLPPLFNRDNFFGKSEDIFPALVSASILALPASAAQDIRGLRRVESSDEQWRQFVGYAGSNP